MTLTFTVIFDCLVLDFCCNFFCTVAITFTVVESAIPKAVELNTSEVDPLPPLVILAVMPVV